MTSAVITHHIELAHDELRALVIAVDHVVYPNDGEQRLESRVYKSLTALHERLWDELRSR